MKSLMKNKNFVLLFNGALVSSIGDVLFNFAMGLYILEITHSALFLSIYSLVSTVVWLICAPFGGALVDRMDRVKLIYITDLIRGSGMLLCGGVMSLTDDPMLIMITLCLTASVMAINGALFGPALQAVLPMIVKKEQLTQANASFSFMYNVKDVFGMLLAGVCYAWLGPILIVFLNGISFIISGVTEMFISVKSKSGATQIQYTQITADLKEGFHYIFKTQPTIIMLLLVINLKNMTVAPIQGVLMPYLMNEYFQVSETNLSTLYMMGAIGGIIGSLVMIKLKDKFSLRQILQGCLLSLGVVTVLQWGGFRLYEINHLTYISLFSIYAGSFLISGVIGILSYVPIITVLQKIVDEQYYGRVMAIFSMISSLSLPLSTLIGGLLIDYVGIEMVYVMCVISVSLASVSCYFIQDFSNVRDTDLSVMEDVNVKQMI